MPLVPINVQATAPAGLSSLRAALAALPGSAPVTVMIHGFKFAPGDGRRCPHHHILAGEPVLTTRRALSWPCHLGIDERHLGIAFGWQASGSLWQAWRQAERAGRALTVVLDLLAAEGHRADIVAHSLGARVALAALRRARAGSVGRVILIHPAEFRAAAAAALASPAGAAAEIVNVTSRENDLFDAAVEWLVAPLSFGARTLGLGLGEPRANWIDLPIDDAETLEALARLGFLVAPPASRVCHWSGYLRPGLFPLYRAILEGALPFCALRAVVPARLAPRWSRLLYLPALPLPFVRKAPL